MGFLFILIYLAIVFAVIEINVILFRLTGLEHEIARFQVISMLTGTGFTTEESELIIEHPLRRKLGAFLILFGAFSLAVIISAITNLLSDSFFAMEIGYIAAILIVLLLVLKIPALQKNLSKKMKSELVHHYKLADLPVSDVIMTGEDDEICEISIEEDSRYEGKTFKEIIDEQEDIMVLFIKRGDVKIRNEAYKTKIQAGDRAILYGDQKTILDKFSDEIMEQTNAPETDELEL
ncbi:TrkA C-terminal domain-containing protein [Bacillus sp. T33-2]|uniref:TrkA C-terminal domain-containing protein n=1 Tax=Bacillus sp. T33-2 TaxID=2054168 RepID=UPI000C772005|nr:TrkA C-terminal domain-containing protein [Bacillus sp. T33-2]PLR96082.1 hypothetical protein CVD19_12280 [Bacillus sp. T33-2]